jgi:hypothetical protein
MQKDGEQEEGEWRLEEDEEEAGGEQRRGGGRRMGRGMEEEQPTW